MSARIKTLCLLALFLINAVAAQQPGTQPPVEGTPYQTVQVDDLSYLEESASSWISRTFRGHVWQSTRYIKEPAGTGATATQVRMTVSRSIGSLCKLGIAIAILFMMFQLLSDYVNIVLPMRGTLTHILTKTLLKFFICVILLTPPVYQWICVSIGDIADSIAAGLSGSTVSGMTVGRSADMTRDLAGMFRALSGGGGSSSSFLMSIGGNLLSGFIAIVVFTVAMIFLIIMPLLQSVLFTFVVYLGPLCLPFMMFDGTSSYARSWLNVLLATAFMGVVGTIAMVLSQTAGFVSDLSIYGQAENFILMLVYGIISIVLMALCYPISASLFGASGGVSSALPMTTKSAALAGAATLGGAAVISKGAGTLINKAGAAANDVGMKSVGKVLSGAGTALTNTGGTMDKARESINKSVGKNRSEKKNQGSEAGQNGSQQSQRRDQAEKPSLQKQNQPSQEHPQQAARPQSPKTEKYPHQKTSHGQRGDTSNQIKNQHTEKPNSPMEQLVRMSEYPREKNDKKTDKVNARDTLMGGVERIADKIDTKHNENTDRDVNNTGKGVTDV